MQVRFCYLRVSQVGARLSIIPFPATRPKTGRSTSILIETKLPIYKIEGTK